MAETPGRVLEIKSVLSICINPWVQNNKKNIGDEVAQQDKYRYRHGEKCQERKVEGLRASDQCAAEPGPGKDAFNQHGACDQLSQP